MASELAYSFPNAELGIGFQSSSSAGGTTLETRSRMIDSAAVATEWSNAEYGRTLEVYALNNDIRTVERSSGSYSISRSSQSTSSFTASNTGTKTRAPFGFESFTSGLTVEGTTDYEYAESASQSYSKETREEAGKIVVNGSFNSTSSYSSRLSSSFSNSNQDERSGVNPFPPPTGNTTTNFNSSSSSSSSASSSSATGMDTKTNNQVGPTWTVGPRPRGGLLMYGSTDKTTYELPDGGIAIDDLVGDTFTPHTDSYSVRTTTQYTTSTVTGTITTTSTTSSARNIGSTSNISYTMNTRYVDYAAGEFINFVNDATVIVASDPCFSLAYNRGDAGVMLPKRCKDIMTLASAVTYTGNGAYVSNEIEDDSGESELTGSSESYFTYEAYNQSAMGYTGKILEYGPYKTVFPVDKFGLGGNLYFKVPMLTTGFKPYTNLHRSAPLYKSYSINLPPSSTKITDTSELDRRTSGICYTAHYVTQVFTANPEDSLTMLTAVTGTGSSWYTQARHGGRGNAGDGVNTLVKQGLMIIDLLDASGHITGSSTILEYSGNMDIGFVGTSISEVLPETVVSYWKQVDAYVALWSQELYDDLAHIITNCS